MDRSCRLWTTQAPWLVLSLIAIILFPFAIWQAWKNMKMAEASPAWPTAEGKVIESKRARVALRLQPRVTYSYAVNGANYVSNRVSFTPAIPKAEIDNVLANYPANRSVTVHYQPDNPVQAVLEPGSGPLVIKQFRVLVILFIVLIMANVARVAVAQFEPAKVKHRTYDDVVVADPKLGDRLIRQDAEKGNAQDQFYVGTWYVTGHDVPKDLAEAAKWFRKSADQGYADAQVYLGEMYGSGNGVEKNIDEAIALFRKAAAQNNPRAFACLGYSYEKASASRGTISKLPNIIVKAATIPALLPVSNDFPNNPSPRARARELT